MQFSVTKTFDNLPVAHQQFFDTNPDGSPGSCASFHGYSRTVRFTVTGDIDDNGYVFPFGAFKKVKSFLEYYFDHTSLSGANDPRMPALLAARDAGILATLRVLPYGVSMEMSALFVWEQTNPYIGASSDGRCYISEIEMRENNKNSGIITFDENTARKQQQNWNKPTLEEKPLWNFVSPKEALSSIKKNV